jgi:hypothetical protein
MRGTWRDGRESNAAEGFRGALTVMQHFEPLMAVSGARAATASLLRGSATRRDVEGASGSRRGRDVERTNRVGFKD